MGKAGLVSDEIDLEKEVARIRVDRALLSSLSWTEVQRDVTVVDANTQEQKTVRYYTYTTTDLEGAKPLTKNFTVYGLGYYDFGLGTEGQLISLATSEITQDGQLSITTGVTQIIPSEEFSSQNLFVYFEKDQTVSVALVISPEYKISDFGTEEFTDFILAELACGDATLVYLPNMLDGLRNLLSKSFAENVKNVYVYELKLEDIQIFASISGTQVSLIHTGVFETFSDASYAQFATEQGALYYIPVKGKCLSTTRRIYSATDVDGVISLSQVSTYIRTNVLPNVQNPVFSINENYINTRYHLYDGEKDRYYYWEPNILQYVELNSFIIPNVFFIWKSTFEEGEILYISFDQPENPEIYNEYMIQFGTGASIPSLSFPASVKWNLAPDLDINTTYQVSVVNNIGLIAGGLE